MTRSFKLELEKNISIFGQKLFDASKHDPSLNLFHISDQKTFKSTRYGSKYVRIDSMSPIDICNVSNIACNHLICGDSSDNNNSSNSNYITGYGSGIVSTTTIMMKTISTTETETSREPEKKI